MQLRRHKNATLGSNEMVKTYGTDHLLTRNSFQAAGQA